MAGLTPTARVPNIDSSTILRFLDRGEDVTVVARTADMFLDGVRAWLETQG